jgi:hypothetical protein
VWCRSCLRLVLLSWWSLPFNQGQWDHIRYGVKGGGRCSGGAWDARGFGGTGNFALSGGGGGREYMTSLFFEI